MASFADLAKRLGKNLEIVLDHQIPALAASGKDQTLPTSTAVVPGGTNGSIGPNEFIEVLAEEYQPPFSTTDGHMENLLERYLLIDEQDSRTFWYESGRADLNLTPAQGQNFLGRKFAYFGGGILGALAVMSEGPRPGEDQADVMLRALKELAVPRASDSIIHVAVAGKTATTGTAHVRYWGIRWTASELKAAFSGVHFGGRVRVRRTWADNGNGINVEFDVPLVGVSPADFTKLPGGTKQDTPLVLPFRRWAINAQATDGNGSEFVFSQNGTSTSNVNPNDPYQNLDFALAQTGQGNQKQDLYDFEDWGVRALVRSNDASDTDLVQTSNQPNMRDQYFRLIGDQPNSRHPNNGLPDTLTDNPNLGGWAYPNLVGESSKLYIPAHARSGERIVAFQQRAYVAMQDAGNSTPIDANTVGAWVVGLLIRGYQNAEVKTNAELGAA